MPQEVQKPGEFRVNDLSTRHPTAFDLTPETAERNALAEALGLLGLRKLRFHGEVAPAGARGWTLRGTLGATVVQPCVVTLEPVTTRIDEKVTRLFVPPEHLDAEGAGAETEMPEDTDTEALGAVISAHTTMVESLSLALPQYPRAPNADPGDTVFSEDGVTPMTDADAKPFAGLAALRDQLGKKD